MDGGWELGVAEIAAPVRVVDSNWDRRGSGRLVSLTKAQAVGKIEKPRKRARMRFSPRHPAESVPEWRNWQTR